MDVYRAQRHKDHLVFSTRTTMIVTKIVDAPVGKYETITNKALVRFLDGMTNGSPAGNAIPMGELLRWASQTIVCGDCKGTAPPVCGDCKGSGDKMCCCDCGHEHTAACGGCDGDGVVICDSCSGRGRLHAIGTIAGSRVALDLLHSALAEVEQLGTNSDVQCLGRGSVAWCESVTVNDGDPDALKVTGFGWTAIVMAYRGACNVPDFPDVVYTPETEHADAQT